MILHKIHIENKFICYQNAKIELNTPGVYLLLGENGTGKTTLLERMVFDTFEAKFPKPDMEALYHSARYRLFAYVPQNVGDCDMTVAAYIRRDNPNVDLDRARELLHELNFEQKDLRESFLSLSGGERLKAAFVSALLKETPYLFLDEPTNYLDDSSVAALLRMIEARAKETVIVIASHDERILRLEATRYRLDGRQIQREAAEPQEGTLRTVPPAKKPPFAKIAFRRIHKPLNYVICFLILALACSLSFFLQYFYAVHYDDTNVPPPNTIAIYSADNVFGPWNQTYCAYAGIEVPESAKHTMIYTRDVPALSKLPGCEAIYIVDVPKHLEFNEQFNQQNTADQLAGNGSAPFEMDLFIYTLPEFLYPDSEFMRVHLFYYFPFLKAGRLPKDGAHEVSISSRLLQSYFGFSEEEAENALGKTITVYDEVYEIVGIQEILDVCIVSYSEDLPDLGVLYRYDPETFPQFERYYESYMEENDYASRNLDSLTIVTKPGREKEVLDYLMKTYPANNYYSSVYKEVWLHEQNTNFLLTIWSVVLGISLLFGVSLMFTQASQNRLNLQRLLEYNRYYFERRRIGWYYCGWNLLLCAGIVGLDMGFLALLEPSFGMMRHLLGLNLVALLLLMLPSLLLICIRVLRARLETNSSPKKQ